MSKAKWAAIGTAILAALGTILLVLTSGCALFAPKYDPISEQHAAEACESVVKYIDPALPDSAKEIARKQAQEWLTYEQAKK